MSQLIAKAIEKTVTCPNCGQRVKVHVAYGSWHCPLCGYGHSSGGSDHKEGRRMAQPSDVTGLLREASRADVPLDRQRELVGAAEQARGEITAQANAEREIDFANAVIRDHLTPARVHEHHTAATDWVDDIDTSGGTNVEQEMTARGSLWYQGLHELVRGNLDEFTAQASGYARREAGAFGEQADVAESTFLTHVGTLRAREVRAGLYEGASGVPQVGEPGNPAADGGLGVGPNQEFGLPGDLTSSNRAPAMQAMEGDGGGPVLDQDNPDDANGDEGDRADDTRLAQTGSRHIFGTNQRSTSMQTAPCPTCGNGRVAVRTQAASGLDQIDQIADPKDNPSQTPYPTEVAFAWEMPQDSQAAIQETEKQLAEREQRKGASRTQLAERAAHQAAQQAYLRVMGGYDDSGWAGDMGAGGVRPGMQDQPGPGPVDSLGYTDPVYGQGGDQGQRDLQPYGEDEADDYTNNPGMNWQPGQPTQADVAGRPNTVGQPTASLRTDDPEVVKALRYAYQRSALLSQR